MTVSLVEILAAARAHVAPLAAESAGYLLLAVADHVVAAPRVVTADQVELMPDGSVRLALRRGGPDGAGVEQVLRRLLGRTLEVSSSVGPALRRAAQRAEDAGLPALVRELEIALIPVNRSAAKRALARLHRETERAKGTGKLAALLAAEAAITAEAPAAPPVVPAPVMTTPVVTAPVVTAPVVTAPVVTAPVVTAPVVPAPVVPAPVVTTPVVAAPVVAAPVAEPPLFVEDPDVEPSPVVLPVVAAVLAPTAPPASAPVTPAVEFTPEPQLAVGEPALTKPEPVVQRARERGNSTPRLGTLITLQTLPGEESQLTERVPPLALADEAALELSVDVEIEMEIEIEPDDVVTPVAALSTQVMRDPEPSCLPDVVMAMLELHTGVQADEAPTRIREVVTELRVDPVLAPAPVSIGTADSAMPAPTPQLTPEPELVEDAWLTNSSLNGVESSARELEPIDPAVHEAVTWNPGPVAPQSSPAPSPRALVIAAPEPAPSPYAPAVLPVRESDVSELVESFYVSDAAEERDLRAALKGMAGLELTPMPHPYVEEG